MASFDKCNHCGLELAEIDGLCDYCLHLPRCVMCGILEVHLCQTCLGWEKRPKGKCWMCEKEYDQSIYDYKLFGNMCKLCSNAFDEWFEENFVV